MLNKIKNLGISELEAKYLIKTSKDINKDYESLKKGFPIQYLIGHVDFFGYKINVNQNVLIPRYETEELVEKVLQFIKQYEIKSPNILDLCTGSGCISVVLSSKLNKEITASDISKDALITAQKNIKENKVKVKLIQSDLFKNISSKFDIIISNPPYVSNSENISNVVKYEPALALYSEDKGTFLIKKIIKESYNYLNEKGILAIEIGEKQGKELIEYSRRYFANSKIEVLKDLSNRDRYLFIFKNFE